MTRTITLLLLTIAFNSVHAHSSGIHQEGALQNTVHFLTQPGHLGLALIIATVCTLLWLAYSRLTKSLRGK